MTHSYDFATFHSRLHFRGELVFSSAHRIGGERSNDVVGPNLPILRSVTGDPYVPGSSFKGAWRSYTEAVLRALQGQDGIIDRNLACQIVGKPRSRQQFTTPDDTCWTLDEVNALKEKWQQDTVESEYDSFDAEL
ncbi:MAG: hypothetical protein KDE59_03875, partial [Anaerolineales bacterium]|nr:hypothetical protein [Anaerolineales bacterium]